MFTGVLKDFLHTSSIHGLRLLLYVTHFKYARLIWSIFMIAVIIWTHFIIATLFIAYIQQPTEVHMSTNMVHVSNTPFPGVALCSANKFNRTQILMLAEKVFENQQTYKPYHVARTVNEMADHLLILKNFYVFPYDNEPLNNTVINGLDEIFTFMFNSTQFPIRDYLRSLAPSCRSLVVRGTIYGENINTLEYFRKRMTSSSACCMFNYKRRSYSKNLKRRYEVDASINRTEQIKFESGTALNSIQIVLQSEPEEFTVTEFRTTAFQLYIFPREDYATIQSTRIGEVLIDYHTIVEVPIEPKYFSSSNQVRQFAPNVRNCYFPDEGEKLLNQSFYSMDECLLYCRLESMLKYCGCVNPPMAATNRNFTHCTFADLPCLMKWKAIWYGWDNYEYVHENGRDIKYYLTSGHRCPTCLPSCNGVEYNLEVNVKSLRSNNGQPYSHDLLDGLNDSKPIAIVKLFFKQSYVLSTEMDIVGDWVVLLNRFGGIMSLMYGFSIVSYIEILYFATGKFFILYFENWKLKLKNKLLNIGKPLNDGKTLNAPNEEKEEQPPVYSLYWKELKQPQQRLVDMEMRVYKNVLITDFSKRHE